jgi:hypothetical protein
LSDRLPKGRQACQAPAKTGQPKVDDARIEPILGAVMALEEELSEV